MATLDGLGFEIERRIIVFHRDTTMPDDTQLGYIGNPNNAINGNTPGETLLFNSPSGTRYLDKSTYPHQRWDKVQDDGGGLWVEAGGSGGSVGGSLCCESFTGKFKNMRSRYLLYGEKPSNLVGLPIFKSCNLTNVVVTTTANSSGWIRIQRNMVDYYSIQLSNTMKVIKTGILRPLVAGDSLQVFVESSLGIHKPTVLVNLV